MKRMARGPLVHRIGLTLGSLLAALVASECGSQGATRGTGNASADSAAEASVLEVDADLACGLPDHPPAPACGAPSCGNGVRDRCASCCQVPLVGGGGGSGGPADAACPSSEVACTLEETCDGTDLGSATCVSAGFPGGTMACTSSCSLDTSGCTTCLSDPHTLACLRAPVPANTPSTLALATTDQDIVIAWVSGPGEGGDAPGTAGTVRVARFGADLSLVAEYDCIGPSHAERVAIARSTTGYMLAISGDGGVTVQPLDSSGAPRGSPRVVPDAQFPMLAAREQEGTIAGGPLLAWSVLPQTTPNAGGLEMQATLLDDDGNPAIAPVTVFSQTGQEPRANYNAVFTGDGFLIASDASQGELARLTLDGTVTRAPVPSSLGNPEYARVAWTGTEGRLVYLDLSATPLASRWVRVDKTGALLGSPVTLSGSIYLAPPVLAVGQDTVVVFGTDQEPIDQANQLSVTRISATGTPMTAPFGVATDPQGLYQPQIALRGPDVVLAWVGGGYPGGIDLARLAP